MTVTTRRIVERIRRHEDRGELVPGDVVVVGHHEPEPHPGGYRFGRRSEDGRYPVERFDEGGTPRLVALCASLDEASQVVFDRLRDVMGERFWGKERWAGNRARVRKGSALRTAALLLCPGWDLLRDRFQAVEALRAIGIPDTAYGVQDANPPSASYSAEGLSQLVHRDGRWMIGVWERGTFTGRAFDNEPLAARAFVQNVVFSLVVSMGGEGIEPHILPAYQDAVRRALEETGGLVSGDRKAFGS
ncbi:hypothetical protein GCM10023085_27160 [Actinomadura viridis]|uniref:Uncharacterized protein n=1 Tax=Actinomadura viridis TaxID=58110 RepID=A0A931DFE2_9ACTN|nr:hypothetical protein [Actinomadura viridis]MBG6087297.1 hypothetical protein [Actinomadura viridis]